MGRTDRILLIIAGVIVVIGLGGAGFWPTSGGRPRSPRRPRSRAAPRSRQRRPPPATATATATATPTRAPTPVSKPKIPNQPHGADFGYVTKVSAKGSTVNVTYDPAELLFGDEARLRASQNGDPLYYNARYAIANDTHKLNTYPLTKKAIVDIIGADGRTETVSPADFVTAFAKQKSLHDTTWWVWASGGSISHIAQVAFPPPH